MVLSLLGKEFSEENMRQVSSWSPCLCTTEILQKLVGQFLQKLTHSLLLPGNLVHGLHLILPHYDDLLFPCKFSAPCFIHYSITHSIIHSLLNQFNKHLLSNKILKARFSINHENTKVNMVRFGHSNPGDLPKELKAVT